MPNDGITPDAQRQLSAILRYFRHGDFNTFCRAANLALGTEASNRPYFCANLLLAYQIAGLCEASNAAGLTEWWASHTDDVRIRSDAPKEIGVSKRWFDSRAGRIDALVEDADRLPLILGCRGIDGNFPDQRSIYAGPIPEFVPPFRDIEKQLCVEVPISDGQTADVETYNCELGRWEAQGRDVQFDCSLSRLRKEYSGFTYYVTHESIGLRFRITQPEWVFVVAYHILPWRLSCLFKVDGETVRMSRAMRLPILMLRAVFAAAHVVRIGHEVVFERVRPECTRALVAYFKNGGDRE